MINEAGLKLIKEFEGLVLTAYPDPGSKNGLPWTIGYGHTKGVKKGDKITATKAEEFLIEDLKVVEAVITKYVKAALNENQYASLVSFIHNIGEGQFARSSVLKYINDGKINEVPGRMALYRMNDGKVMQGLVRRRLAEGELWMKPLNIVQKPPEQGSAVEAQPANPKKPFDWGATGAFVTLLAGMSDQVKKLIGNITSAFGFEPWILLAAAGVGFLGWTFYSKWKDK